MIHLDNRQEPLQISGLSWRLTLGAVVFGLLGGWILGTITQAMVFPDRFIEALPLQLFIAGWFGLGAGLCTGITTVVARGVFARKPHSRLRVLRVVSIAAAVSSMVFYLLFWVRTYPEFIPWWTTPLVGVLAAFGAYFLTSRTVHEP